LGVIQPHSQISSIIKITNTGTIPLKLEKPISGCTCTVIGLEKGSHILPNTFVELPIHYNSKKQVFDSQQLYFSVVDPQSGNTGIIAAHILAWQHVGAFDWTPQTIDFGTISRMSRSTTRYLRLRDRRSDRVAVSNVTSSSDAISAKVTSRIRNSRLALHDHIIELQLAASPLPSGKGSATLRIDTTSSYMPSVRIPVIWNIAPRVYCTPAAAVFDQGNRSIELTLRTSADGDFLIGETYAPPGFAFQERAGQNSPMSLTLLANDEPVPSGVASVTVYGPNWTEVIEIPCSVGP
jgi:hypothetical protein